MRCGILNSLSLRLGELCLVLGWTPDRLLLTSPNPSLAGFYKTLKQVRLHLFLWQHFLGSPSTALLGDTEVSELHLPFQAFSLVQRAQSRIRVCIMEIDRCSHQQESRIGHINAFCHLLVQISNNCIPGKSELVRVSERIIQFLTKAKAVTLQ